jgi:glutathione S-transferase
VKLFFSPASPFARKVLACAIARGIDGQIALVPTDPWVRPTDLVAANPLSKIPTLLTPDGRALFDSPVICEYLDSLEGDLPLFPPVGGARWRALTLQALADGIMESGVVRRRESLRPAGEQRADTMAAHKGAIDRALASLEADVPHQTPEIGTIAIACALGYLDFRFGHEPWRPACPKLATWYEAFASNPCIARTMPS